MPTYAYANVALVDDGDPGGRERLFWIPCVSPQMTSR